MTAEQIARCKAQQLKQLVYAERLNKGLPLDLGDHTVGEVAHLQGVWELGDVDGERTHHMHGQEEESVGGNEQLACLQECGHQRAWLPLPGGKAERVCVTRRGQRNCVERESWAASSPVQGRPERCLGLSPSERSKKMMTVK